LTYMMGVRLGFWTIGKIWVDLNFFGEIPRDLFTRANGNRTAPLAP
jgi:hypothetical protein